MSARAIKGGEPHGPGALGSRSQESSKADIERSRGLERSPEISLLQKAYLGVIPAQPQLGHRGAALPLDWLVRTVITRSDCLGDQILLTFLLTNF